MTTPLLDALLTRRSVLAKDLQAPGPNKEEIDAILAAGHRVPDHGKIGPWRFVMFEGDSRADFGKALRDIFLADNPDTTEKCLSFEEERFLRAPLVVAVISSPIEHKVPQWEQTLCAGAVCQNILNACHALGYGAQWLTEWYAYHAKVNQLLELSSDEQIAGFIYVGSKEQPPKERNRPELADRIHYWKAAE